MSVDDNARGQVGELCFSLPMKPVLLTPSAQRVVDDDEKGERKVSSPTCQLVRGESCSKERQEKATFGSREG